MLLTNKKGTVLVVAVTAMMIMGIIGLVCLQIYTNQSILDHYDQIKKRTFYSAEAGIEMMRGFIINRRDANFNPSDGDVYLYEATKDGKNWCPFTDKPNNYKIYFTTTKFGTTSYTNIYGTSYVKGENKPYLKDAESFDVGIYPPTKVKVFLHRVNSGDTLVTADNVTELTGHYGSGTDKRNRAYVIVSEATAEHRSQMGVNTVKTSIRYYFYTQNSSGLDVKNTIKWAAWRID